MRPGDDPCLMPGGLHAKNKAANLGVPKLIGAIPGFCCKNDALSEGGGHRAERP